MCSCGQSLVTLAFLWDTLSQPQFYLNLTRKTPLFDGWSWFKFNNLVLALGKNLKFYTSVAKELKLKVTKFWGLILAFVEVTWEKVVGWREGEVSPPPTLILNRAKETKIKAKAWKSSMEEKYILINELLKRVNKSVCRFRENKKINKIIRLSTCLYKFVLTFKWWN